MGEGVLIRVGALMQRFTVLLVPFYYWDYKIRHVLMKLDHFLFNVIRVSSFSH